MKSFQDDHKGKDLKGARCIQTESLSVLNLPPYRLAALSQVKKIHLSRLTLIQ